MTVTHQTRDSSHSLQRGPKRVAGTASACELSLDTFAVNSQEASFITCRLLSTSIIHGAYVF